MIYRFENSLYTSKWAEFKETVTPVNTIIDGRYWDSLNWSPCSHYNNIQHVINCYASSQWTMTIHSGYDPNDLQLDLPENKNMEDWINLPKGKHEHVWKHYQGLNESFEYCDICDEKRNK